MVLEARYRKQKGPRGRPFIRPWMPRVARGKGEVADQYIGMRVIGKEEVGHAIAMNKARHDNGGRRLTGGVQLGEYSPPAPCFDLTAINSAISLFVFVACVCARHVGEGTGVN